MEKRDLRVIKKEIENQRKEIDILSDSWLKEVKIVSDVPGFNPNNRKGEKALKKVADEYAQMFNDAEDKLNELIDEYNALIEEGDKKLKSENITD